MTSQSSYKVVCFVILLLVGLMKNLGHAQTTYNEELQGSDSLWKVIGKTITQKKDLGKGRIFSLIIFPFYTPELEFGIALGGLFSFQADAAEDSQQQRSNLRANILKRVTMI